MTNVVQYKLICTDSLIDEAFDKNRTRDFKLVLQIGLEGVLIGVNEKATNKFIAFERYNFQQVYRFEDACTLIDELSRQSKLVNHSYPTVDCLIINNFSTLVPKPVFEEDRKQTYLKFNTPLEGDELILTDDLKALDAKNIFALPLCVKGKLDFLFSNVRYHHFSSVLIEALLRQHKNQSAKKVWVHIQATHFQIVVLEGKQLLFYNTFNHHSAEDFIYYLLFVFEQLHLNPEKTEVHLLGEIEKNSAIHLITQKYVRQVVFGERGDQSDYSYQLQTLPKHSYFNLFNIYSI
jgi:hypothetical protein